MLKKCLGIALLVAGGIFFSLGMIKLVFDGIGGTNIYLHVIVGLILVGIGVFLIKKA